MYGILIRMFVLAGWAVTQTPAAEQQGSSSPAEMQPLPLPADASAPTDVPPAPAQPEVAPAPPAAPPSPGPEAAPAEKPASSQGASDPGNCRDEAPKKGILSLGLPAWASGAIVGGTVGVFGAALAALLVSATAAFAVSRSVIPALPAPLSAAALIFPAFLLAGALLGAGVGALVTPFLPRLGLTRPCKEKLVLDPTLRRSGDER